MVAFISIFLFVIVAFGLAFHLAFGLAVFEYRDFEYSFLSLVSFVFGNPETEFSSQHRIMGPIYLLVFTFGVSFILTVKKISS